MRLLQFIKWWWKNNDNFNRTIACYVIFSVLPTVIAAIFIGKEATIVMVIGVVVIAGYWGIYSLYHFIRNLWKDFNDMHPTEDEAIIRKLKGIPTPSRSKDDLHEYY